MAGYRDLDPEQPYARKGVRKGRPTTLDQQTHQKIVQAVASGLPLTTAATINGINPNQVHEWVARGLGRHPTRPQTRAFADFAEDLMQAREEAKAAAILLVSSAAQGGRRFDERTTVTKVVTTAASEDTEAEQRREVTETVTERVMLPDWRAGAWMLSRMYPEEWAAREAHAGRQGAGSGPLGSGVPDGFGDIEPAEMAMAMGLVASLREAAAEARQLPASTGQGIEYAEVIDEEGRRLDDDGEALAGDDLDDLLREDG